MFQKEELIGKETQVLQAMLEADVQKYAVEVETIETKEEVLNLEVELVEQMKTNEAALANVVYELPEECNFDGTVFGRKVICDYIVDFLNNQELEWSYSLGMYELVKLWKNRDITEVSYHAFDSTIRVLGQCKYKGYDAWRKVLAVNEFLTTLHDQYMVDTTYIIYLSQLHNVLIDALKKFEETPTDLPTE